MAQRGRVSVQTTGLRTPNRIAVSQPVDTYVHPGASSDLAQLAQGLAQLQPSLGRFSQTLVQRKAQEDFAAGTAAMRKAQEEGQTLAEAQRTGRIPQQANPWFMAGLKEQQGRVAADQWLVGFRETMQGLQSPPKTVEDFEAFMNQHQQDWLKKNLGDARDGYVEKGFGGRSDAYRQNERLAFVAGLERRLGKESVEAHFAETKAALRQGVTTGVPGQSIGEALDVLLQDANAQGRDMKALRQATVDAVKAAALDDEENAEKYLEVLAHISGEAGKLNDSSYASEEIPKLRDAILEKRWQRRTRDKQQDTWDRQERVREASTKAIDLLITDSNADLSEVLETIRDVPEALDDVRGLVLASKDLEYRTDEQVNIDLHGRIYPSRPPGSPRTTVAEINRQVAAKKLTLTDARKLINELEEQNALYRAEGGREPGMFSDIAFKQVMQRIPGSFTGFLRMPGAEKDREAGARTQFTAWWSANWDKGDNLSTMSPTERSELATRKAQSVVEYWRTGTMAMEDKSVPTLPTLAPKQYVPPESLVVDEADLLEALRGIPSPNLDQKADAAGVATPEQYQDFVKRQAAMFKAQHGRSPEAPKPEPVKEPGLWDRLTGNPPSSE